MNLLDRRGFTLLEILLATLLLSIVAVAVVGAIRLGVRSVQKAEAKVQELDTIRGLYLNLERQLSSVVLSTRWVDGKRFVWFEGDKRGFQFLSTSSLLGSRDSFVEVSYTVEETDRGFQLIERERLPGEEKGVSIVLMDNIDKVVFLYLDQEMEWKEEFKESKVFPRAVALVIKKGKIEREMIFPVYSGSRGSTSETEEVDILEVLRRTLK